MNARFHSSHLLPWRAVALAAAIFLGASCHRSVKERFQGYVEGEFVYVASPLAGQLESLQVQRGMQVKAGAPLFSLERGLEMAALDEAARKLGQGRANLEDLKKGKRPVEIESAEQQLKQARAALVLSEKEFQRQSDLSGRGVNSAQDFDRARSARDQDQHRVSQLEAELATARLGSRDDQVAGAEANARALEASVAQATWSLNQKRQTAPLDGLVFDTLYWPGEWVSAGHPVITLLPPANIKVRAFVPETRVGALRLGQTARVFVDGVNEPFIGALTFISPQAEYTPPVIYSQESRGKLVFMVEARFDAATSVKLHPGQPVDMEFAP